VVTYVANADNYKKQYENLRADRDSLRKKSDGLTQQVNEKIEASKQLESKLSGEIASLRAEVDSLKVSLSSAEREKAALVQKLDGWASIVKDFRETNDSQAQLLQKAMDDLKVVEAQQIKDQKELTETTAALMEKMAIIETLRADSKSLVEQNVALQAKLDTYLQPLGQQAVAVAPAAPVRPARTMMPAPVENIDLKALVTQVDLKNSLAGISIGAADGVKEGMKFHVTRGDDFLCDILIIDVDAEQSIGVLDLVQQQPRVGDSASTNL